MTSNMPQDFGTPFLLEDYTSITPPVTTNSPPLCATCHTSASPLRCSTCKSIHYCIPACQSLDWPIHKLLCKQLASTSNHSIPPTPSHRCALYLPASSEKPSPVWLQYGDDGRSLDRAKCFPGTLAGEVKTIAFHNRFLPYWIQISCDGNPRARPLASNKCVDRLLTTAALPANASEIPHEAGSPGDVGSETWRGPLLVVAYSAEGGLSEPALDVDAGVLGPVVEYLRLRREYDGPVFVEQPQERYSQEEWKLLLNKEE